jgi:hypothetical protein
MVDEAMDGIFDQQFPQSGRQHLSLTAEEVKNCVAHKHLTKAKELALASPGVAATP